ncbi:phosphomannose isomerase type II C-terminal cupin domain [bacterium]|nr:phosphomannose isomerase type II C-terminal cupin domain [bacterium]
MSIQDSCEKVVRPWGYFINIADGDGYLSKIIHVNPDGKLSVQSHNHRSEHWFVIKGTAKVTLKKQDFILNAGQSIDIPVKAVHSVQNPYQTDLEIIEIQQGDLLSEDDIIRYEDIYGRVTKI